MFSLIRANTRQIKTTQTPLSLGDFIHYWRSPYERQVVKKTVILSAIALLVSCYSSITIAQTQAQTTAQSNTEATDISTKGNQESISEALEPVSIEYKIRISKFGNAVLGKVRSELSETDTGYAINSVTQAQGMALLLMQSNLRESCEFEVVNGRAVARSYAGGTVKKTQYSVAYDWENRKVSLTEAESLDMPQGYVVDNCTMWFATALLKGKLPENEGVYVVDGKSKRIRGYRLRSTEEEIVDTALGQRDTVKMVLERELRPERTLTFWLSKSDQYLPVKIEESRKSRTTTFEISDLTKT